MNWKIHPKFTMFIRTTQKKLQQKDFSLLLQYYIANLRLLRVIKSFQLADNRRKRSVYTGLALLFAE
jgi:hypothetical protein